MGDIDYPTNRYPFPLIRADSLLVVEHTQDKILAAFQNCAGGRADRLIAATTKRLAEIVSEERLKLEE
jgi:hypothetical protein